MAFGPRRYAVDHVVHAARPVRSGRPARPAGPLSAIVHPGIPPAACREAPAEAAGPTGLRSSGRALRRRRCRRRLVRSSLGHPKSEPEGRAGAGRGQRPVPARPIGKSYPAHDESVLEPYGTSPLILLPSGGAGCGPRGLTGHDGTSTGTEVDMRKRLVATVAPLGLAAMLMAGGGGAGGAGAARRLGGRGRIGEVHHRQTGDD